MSIRYFRSVLLLALCVTFTISALFNRGFNGFPAEQFPYAHARTALRPAEFSFAIWAVIFVWLIVSAAYGIARRAEDPVWDFGRAPLMISLGVGAAWVPVAQVSAVAATVLIWVMLAGAVAGLLRAPCDRPCMLGVPLGLYAGWLTAAANIALARVLAGYGLLDPQSAAVFCLMLALCIAGLVLTARPLSRGYAVALAWALIGICVANAGQNLQDSNVVILGLSTIGIGMIAARLSVVVHLPPHGAAWDTRRL